MDEFPFLLVLPAAAESICKDFLVGMLQDAARRDATRQSRDLYWHLAKQV